MLVCEKTKRRKKKEKRKKKKKKEEGPEWTGVQMLYFVLLVTFLDDLHI
jgi:hypothetical protein